MTSDNEKENVTYKNDVKYENYNTQMDEPLEQSDTSAKNSGPDSFGQEMEQAQTKNETEGPIDALHANAKDEQELKENEDDKELIQHEGSIQQEESLSSTMNHSSQFSQIRKGSSVFFAGPLRKLGQVNKSFKKRHFVLNNASLSYFKNSQATVPIQSIPLKYTHVQESSKFAYLETSFEIVTANRVYYLLSDTIAEKKMWIHELSQVCAGQKRWLDAILVMEERIRNANIANWRTKEKWAKEAVLKKLEMKMQDEGDNLIYLQY